MCEPTADTLKPSFENIVLVETIDGKPTGRKLGISKDLAELSGRIHDYVTAMDGEFKEVPLRVDPDPEFHFDHVKFVDQYVNLYGKNNQALRVKDDEKMKPMVHPSKLAQEFFDQLTKEDLFGTVNLGEFLQLNSLVRDAAAYIARRMHGTSVTQRRDYLNEENDYTAQEWAQMTESPAVREVMLKEGLLDEK
ncbi:glycoprotein FP21 precursor [Aphelenchoides avenae]|nr:glycoprotein FP21 precursor [Aphelenchus avenae]